MISVSDVSDSTQGIAVVLAIDVSESTMGEPHHRYHITARLGKVGVNEWEIRFA